MRIAALTLLGLGVWFTRPIPLPSQVVATSKIGRKAGLRRLVTADFFSTVSISDLRRGVTQFLVRCVRKEETCGVSPLAWTIILTNYVAALTDDHLVARFS